MNTVNSDVISDLKDGKKFSNLSPNTLPFVIFYDELETGNALGSHKGVHKIGSFYVALRCFPTNFYSKLKNIYICALFPSNARGDIDNLLLRLVTDIIFLQSKGISIGNTNILFRFVGITGDNVWVSIKF